MWRKGNLMGVNIEGSDGLAVRMTAYQYKHSADDSIATEWRHQNKLNPTILCTQKIYKRAADYFQL